MKYLPLDVKQQSINQSNLSGLFDQCTSDLSHGYSTMDSYNINFDVVFYKTKMANPGLNAPTSHIVIIMTSPLLL